MRSSSARTPREAALAHARLRARLRGEPATELVEPAARPRCWTCFKPETFCVCGRVPRVENRTAITILQHPRERFHAIGTARIARLGLLRSQLLIPRSPVTRSLAVPVDPAPGTGVLFPGEGSVDLADVDPAARPTGLVVLDGTWGQAGKLFRANEWLMELPRYRLDPEAPTRYRIRRAPRRSYISTIEAIVAALKIVEPETPGLDGLLAAFDEMIDTQAAYSHRVPRRPERKLRRQGRL